MKVSEGAGSHASATQTSGFLVEDGILSTGFREVRSRPIMPSPHQPISQCAEKTQTAPHGRSSH